MKHAKGGQQWLGLVWILIVLASMREAEACSCMPFPDDPEKAVATAYARADAIFLGDVTAIRSASTGSLQQHEVTFLAFDRWKRPLSDGTVVRTNDGEIACGSDFRKNRRYLVLAYWDQQQKVLTTSFCDLNSTEAYATNAIAVLNRLTQRTKEGEQQGSN